MQKPLLVLAALLPGLSLAQTATPSRITQVLVYPGGATIERSAKVAAGAKELRLACLPAHFDIDSLKVQADDGIQVGDVSVQTVERARAPECANSALDMRIRELEDKQAAIRAENGAQDLVLAYLKNYGGDKQTAGSPIGATAEQLRRSGQEALQRQHQAQRRIEELEAQLTPLQLERNKLRDANPQVSAVLVRVAARNEGEIRLSYRIAGAGWSPQYRAYLDTAKSQLRLERHAQVAQTSGEDWSGVNLRLSTVQANQANRLNPPQPWALDIRPPVTTVAISGSSIKSDLFAAPAAMHAPVAMARAVAPASKEDVPNFDVSVFQGAYAAEFAVPGKVNLASSGQRIAFALGDLAMPAQLLTRIQPQQASQAYLLAELARPAGSWPAGELQLFRDGEFIGKSQLRLGSEEKMELFFGRDDLVRVQTEPEQRDGANKGFIGSRAEQKFQRAYVLENLHQTPVTVQLLETSPVARHADIQVQSQFNPKPTQENWHKQAGVVAWQLPLAAGKTIRIAAEYLISYPKDAVVSGMR